MNEVVSGHVAWGLLLQKTGKIQAELLLWGRSDQVFLLVLGGNPSAVRETLEHYLVMEDAELAEKGDVSAWILLDVDAGALGFTFRSAPIAPGALLGIVPKESEAAFCESLRAASIQIQPHSELTLTDYGKPTFGVDFGPEDNPHEASLERRAVAWSKGCYLGQEVVYMQEARGKLKRRLYWLQPKDGGPPAPKGTEVFGPAQKDSPIGRVTSAGSRRNLASIRLSDREAPPVFLLEGREFVPLSFPGTT